MASYLSSGSMLKGYEKQSIHQSVYRLQAQLCLRYERSQTSLELLFSHRRCFTKNLTTMGEESPVFSQQWLQFGKSTGTIYGHFSKLSEGRKSNFIFKLENPKTSITGRLRIQLFPLLETIS